MGRPQKTMACPTGQRSRNQIRNKRREESVTARGALCTAVDEADDFETEPGHEGGGWDGEDPGPKDVGGEAPAHGFQALDGADSGDGTGDDVGGGDRLVDGG